MSTLPNHPGGRDCGGGSDDSVTRQLGLTNGRGDTLILVAIPS